MMMLELELAEIVVGGGGGGIPPLRKKRWGHSPSVGGGDG